MLVRAWARKFMTTGITQTDRMMGAYIKCYVQWTVILLVLCFISGCGSVETKRNLPVFEVVSSSLSRGIEDKGTGSTPLDLSTIYYLNDPEVISCIKLANISGEHKIRWEWYRPGRKLYCSTDSQRLSIGSNTYHKEMCIWHKISLAGEKAVEYPGTWRVDIYFDNHLISSSPFDLKPEINIEYLPVVARHTKASDWALIIGIENYGNLPKATYATNDALLVRDYFNKVLGVPEENIILLMDSEATKGKIEGILKSYLPMNVKGDTTLYVYFAGHGVPGLKEGDAFIVTYDGDPRFIEHTGYKLEVFYRDISLLPLSKAIVFVDGCFSGGASRNQQQLVADSRPALLRVDAIELSSDNVIALTASQGNQMSGAYPEKGHGLFTYFLLSGLRGPADSDQNRIITLDELYSYAAEHVEKISRRKGVQQIPVIIPGIAAAREIRLTEY